MSKERKVDQGIVLSILLLGSVVLTGFPILAGITAESACGGSSCGSGSSGSSGCGSAGASCGSGGSCATTGSSGCGSSLGSRGSGGSSLGSSPNVVSSGSYVGGKASGCGSQTSGLAGGCQAGANSGCSGAATGCGPPSYEGGGGASGAGSVSSGRIFNGFGSAPLEEDFEDVSGSEEWPQALVDISIKVSNSTPSVGDKIALVLTVKASKDYPDAIIELLLPSGVEYISGDLNWAGDLQISKEKSLTASVQVLEDGVWEIVGKMIALEGEVDRIGKMDKLVLLVGEEAVLQYDAMMKALTNPEQSAIRIADPVAAEAFVSPASPGTVTIYGYFNLHECRCDTADDNDCPCPTCVGSNCVSNGGASHFHGMPYTLIELWDHDTDTPDDLVTARYTDVNGYYHFDNIENADFDEDGTNDYYVKFRLLGWPPIQTGYTWVQPLGTKSEQYAYSTTWPIGILPDGTVRNVGTIYPADSRRANILYAVMKECYWMMNHCYGWDMPNVCVFYPYEGGSNAHISTYEIEISTQHAMDDDIVLHEYAHLVMSYYYGNWPAWGCSMAVEGCSGGCTACYNHGGSLNNCSCDGVSEGWANFVAAIVPEEWDTRNWATDRYVVSKDGLVYRDHESNAVVHEYDEMTFARILWDILDPMADGETAEVLFEKGTVASDYDHNPIWWEMTRQNPGNEHSFQEEPYTLVELWIFWLESFPYGETTVGEPQLCNIYSLHGVTRDFTNRCSAACYGYCNGACDFCVPHCAVDPCGGAGCPGAGCYDCATGWCDADQPGQGCNGAWPSQCDCYRHGVTSVCSNAPPYVYCVSGCWVNPCACAGVGCPGAGCYSCTGTVIDSCDCGGDTCICGSENDCTAYATNNYMPCGGTVPDPCVCGGAECACVADAMDCAANPTAYKPCGGVISCACGGAGCTCADYCCLAPPSPGGWVLLATDPDEGVGTSLKEIWGQRHSGVIYFKVEHYRFWPSITSIDTAIFIDADQNPGTGQPDASYPGQMTGIGADYAIIVGWEGTETWRWVGSWWDTTNPISLAYLDAPGNATAFVVGIRLADLPPTAAIDCAVSDVNSNWDWMPDTGHFIIELPTWTPCGGTVVDTCDCGVALCACGFESDCAAYAVDDFWPCGIIAAQDVAVIAVTQSKTVVSQGYPLLIDVTVENHGACTESFNLIVYYGDYAITAEQWETFWSMGDVNRDGYINGTDQNLLSAAFGTTPESPNWNPWADLNQDLQVNMVDISIFAYNFGLEIWTYAISGGVIGTLPVIDLAAGTTRTLTFTWDTSGIPYGSYVIGSYAVPIMGKEPPLGRELDRADNTFADGTVTVTIPGDIDGDGDVDYDDFIILAGAYASAAGEPAYNPQADIDGDGNVDYDDFIVLAGNYSKSIPQ